MDLAEADAAKANLVQIEDRLAEGENVSREEREAAHARYQEAEVWRSEQETAQRRADMQSQGIVPGPNQGIGLGSNP